MHKDIIWTSTEAEIVTGGRNTRDWCATGVSLNIDDIKPGDLYIATKDDDLDLVFQRGAAAAALLAGQGAGCEWPLLKVGSVFQALQDLARAARFKTHAHIISVQGRAAREQIGTVLGNAGRVHEGGRHLSLGLAGLPEDVDYGLFGSSPAVQPDIAVITNSARANRDTLFETMPVSGTVLIHTDDDYLRVVARAKAAGIEHIYTYGAAQHADARLLELLDAGNGTRISVNILGEEHSFTLPSGDVMPAAFIAGLLTLKLMGKSLSSARPKHGAGALDVAAVNNISLIDPMLEKSGAPQAVFKVTNMIDLGFGRQTAILDNLANFSQKSLCFPKKDLSIPRRVESMNFMYTNKTIGAVRNAHDAIQKAHKNARIEEISPQALVPGDFVVFKDIQKRSKAVFSEALRLIPNLRGTRLKDAHLKHTSLKHKKVRTPHAV